MPAWSGEGSAVAIAPVRDALRTTSCVTRCGAWRAPFTGGPCRGERRTSSPRCSKGLARTFSVPQGTSVPEQSPRFPLLPG